MSLITKRQALIGGSAVMLLGRSGRLFAQATEATKYTKGENVEVRRNGVWIPGTYDQFLPYSNMAATPHKANFSNGYANFAPADIRKPTGQVAKQPKATPAVPKDAASLTALEAAIITEINALRSNPVGWAAKLDALKASYTYDGKSYVDVDGEGSWFQSNMTGFVADVGEAIDALKNTGSKPGPAVPPLVTLAKNDVLRSVADMMASDAGKIDGPNHKDSQGRDLFARAKARNYAHKAINECIPGGTLSAFGTVAQLIIDHGVASRGHRKNLVAKDVTQIGVAVKYWPAAGTVSEYLRIVIVCGAPA
jgi:uncharacterized protein YkwD